MIKTILFVALCSINPLLAQQTPTTNENHQIGRYQMVSTKNGGLYLLDTATGYLWRGVVKSDRWSYIYDHWELELSTPPQHP